MANVQGRCDFPTGESMMTSKLTDSKSEDSDVLTSVDVTSGLMQAIGKKINSGVETIVGARRSTPATCIVLPQFNCTNSLADQQQQQMYFQNNNNPKSIVNNVGNLKNNSNVWVDLPAKFESTMDTENDNVAWQQLSNVKINTLTTELPLYHHQDLIIDVEMKQQQVQPRDNRDIFQNLENVASNSFDLLSYLCEDDISSPGDSMATNSSQEINDLSKLSNLSAHTVVSPKTYEPITSSIITPTDTFKSKFHAADLLYSQESSNSAISSISSKPIIPPESPNSAISSTSSRPAISTRSSSHQLRTIVKLEKPENLPTERRSMRPRRIHMNSNFSHNGTSQGTGKKRLLSNENESDDDSYRDTREKNNEASRKSRMNKKAKEQEMAKKAMELEKDNRVLKMKVEELEKLVSSIRNALLRSALKKEIKNNIF